MSNGLKIYRRLISVLVALVVLSGLVFLLTRLELIQFSEKPNPLKLQLKNINLLLEVPPLQWMQKEGDTQIDLYHQEVIGTQYLEAWRMLNLTFENNDVTGLSDYFSNSLISAVNTPFQHSRLSFQRSDINHQITPYLFSHDQQLIAFRDSNVLVVTEIRDSVDQTVIRHDKIIHHYEVIMKLQDGRWKINHMIQHNTQKESLKPSITFESINIGRGINYYPADYPWLDFWSYYKPDLVQADFKTIREAGFQSVRIFIPYQPNPHSDLINDIKHLLKAAEKHQLKIVLTLFDFPKEYDVRKYGVHFNYLSKVINAVLKSEALLAYDIKNEADLDFKKHGKEKVLRWLTFIVEEIKKMDPYHPLTVGWSHEDHSGNLLDLLDFVSFHYYRQPKDLSEVINQVKSTTSLPIAVTEYGCPTFKIPYLPIESTVEDQSTYLDDVQSQLKLNGISDEMIWTYSDFSIAPSYVFGWNPITKIKQKGFGLWDVKGNKKRITTNISPN